MTTHSTAQTVKEYVSGKLQALRRLPEHPQKAALAQLRRGIGHPPGDLPELWGTFLPQMPPAWQSSTGEPSRAEWAVYLALTLFAVHQQGRSMSEKTMNEPGIDLGSAARRLVPPGEEAEDGSAFRRFNALATAGSIEELAHHLRGMVQLLRAGDIPLDYGQLAADVYQWQKPEEAARVRLRWGQAFYRRTEKDDEQQ